MTMEPILHSKKMAIANSSRREIFFIIFVDAIFTTLMQRPFTNAFDVIARTQQIVACIGPATPINSLAT